MPRLVTFPLLALAILVLAACGGGGGDSASDFTGAEQEVARAIEDLEEAGQEDEPGRICRALLAREVVERIEQAGDGDCTKAVERALDQADTFTLTVEDVTVSGDKATARVETGVDEEKVETIELVREDGGWRVAALPGAPS